MIVERALPLRLSSSPPGGGAVGAPFANFGYPYPYMYPHPGLPAKANEPLKKKRGRPSKRKKRNKQAKAEVRPRPRCWADRARWQLALNPLVCPG